VAVRGGETPSARTVVGGNLSRAKVVRIDDSCWAPAREAPVRPGRAAGAAAWAQFAASPADPAGIPPTEPSAVRLPSGAMA